MCFESTMIQTDSEKILCIQKIPPKRFFGRWKISVGTLFEISKFWTNSEKHKSFLCMYQKNYYNCTHVKNYKKYITLQLVKKGESTFDFLCKISTLLHTVMNDQYIRVYYTSISMCVKFNTNLLFERSNK